jgi:hypothetical protein
LRTPAINVIILNKSVAITMETMAISMLGRFIVWELRLDATAKAERITYIIEKEISLIFRRDLRVEFLRMKMQTR